MNEYERVAELMKNPKAVFVFGSNEAGVHGAGAALVARKLYGAEMGHSRGSRGRSYAIATKDKYFRPLPLARIQADVEYMRRLAIDFPSVIFVVTKIGCGLAGYTEDQIMPMFQGAPDNVILPEGWTR